MFVRGLQTYHGLCTMLRTMFRVFACHTSHTTLLFGLTLVTLDHSFSGTSARNEFNTIRWHKVRPSGYQGRTKSQLKKKKNDYKLGASMQYEYKYMFTTTQLWAVAAMCWQHYIHPYPLFGHRGWCFCLNLSHAAEKRHHNEVFWEQISTSTKWNTAAGISHTLNIFGGFRGYHTFARGQQSALQ